MTLSSPELPDVELRSVEETDQENLRTWKNEHRKFFFYQKVISAADQKKWFWGYLERGHDFMFIVEVCNRPVGCMGFRFLDDKNQVDIYNVIRGVSEAGQKGSMSRAFRLMCSYAGQVYPGRQGLKVLSNNPAIGWYERNGMKKIREVDNYYEMVLDRFEPCQVQENATI